MPPAASATSTTPPTAAHSQVGVAGTRALSALSPASGLLLLIVRSFVLETQYGLCGIDDARRR
jgi:hypothetical protein